jgi:hypothetical protein
LKIKAFSVIYGAPEGIRIPDLPLRRSTPKGQSATF